MIKRIRWTRMIFGLVVVFFSLAFSQPVFALNPMRNVTNEDNTLKILQKLQGEWRDDNGTAILTFRDKYINECEVEAIYDCAGGSSLAGATFRILERTGGRDIRISWFIMGDPTDYITGNNEQMLHRAEKYYFESVGGIHLGMSADHVKQILGKPSKISQKGVWHYKNKGLSIQFRGGGVFSIDLLKGSPLSFAQSGLNCSNSLTDFANAYSATWNKRSPIGGHSIGNGEYLYFNKGNMDRVTLSVFLW